MGRRGNSLHSAADFGGKHALVVGLGRFGGGVGVTRWLAGRGARVTVTDSAPPETLADSVASLSDLGVEFCLGGHEGVSPGDYDLAIVNPAVRKDQSALFQAIQAADVPWTTELNLFCERCPAFVFGVTGSYGKSTTCAMLAHVLEATWREAKSAKSRIYLGGNIGGSLLNELPSIAADDLVVLEISNAQLEDLPRIGWTPHLAIITNLSPHHLDRHGSYAGYLAAKLNIIDPKDATQAVIVGDLDQEAERRLWEKVVVHPGRVVRVRPPTAPIELAIPGPHNRRNAACVLAVSAAAGLPEGRVRQGLGEFRGLPHRLEFVRTIRGVRYINDSKSTAPAATITALRAVLEHAKAEADARRLIVLVGGQDKHLPLDDCAALLASRARVVLCFGQAGPAFAEAVRRAAARDNAPVSVHVTDDVRSGARFAHAQAQEGDTVLFSPGAPSFDQYANFTERGRHFVEVIGELE